MAKPESSSSEDDSLFLSQVASVAVDGAHIFSNAASSRQAAAQTVPTSLVGKSLESLEPSSRNDSGLFREFNQDEGPLHASLALKLTKQLHQILDHTLGNLASPSSCQGADPGIPDQEELESCQIVDAGIRVFKGIREGTTCSISHTASRTSARTSWSGVLRCRFGDSSDDDLKVVQAAQIVAVEPHELLKSAEAMASVASRLVTCERDSSEEDWKSGVKPGSSISGNPAAPGAKQCILQDEAITLAYGVPKRKRKGKHERRKDQALRIHAKDLAVCPSTGVDIDKITRKRAKRRIHKKRRKQSASLHRLE